MRSLIRSAAALSGSLLLVPVLAGPSSAAQPAPLAGSWLAHQIRTGVVHNDQFGFDDYGLTADTALALKELGGHKATLRKTRKVLAANVDSWVAPGDDVYAGSVAKAAVVARALGAKPRSFGGVNLVRQLAATVTPTGPAEGRIRDTSAFGDYANTVGQAYAAQALAAARSRKAGSVIRFLVAQQCSAGYFRLNFAAPTAASQKCTPGDAVGSAPDTDATALAVLSLRSIEHPGRRVRASLTKATRWLKRSQHRDGSFGGGPTTSAANANSTGVAGWALAEAGACRQAGKAARWVKRLQVGPRAGGPLAHERGAIAYDAAALTAARTVGITTTSRDQWRRATSQAAPVLRYLRGC